MLHVKQAKVDEGLKGTKTYGSNRRLPIPPEIKAMLDSRPHAGDFIIPDSRRTIARFDYYCKRPANSIIVSTTCATPDHQKSPVVVVTSGFFPRMQGSPVRFEEGGEFLKTKSSGRFSLHERRGELIGDRCISALLSF